MLNRYFIIIFISFYKMTDAQDLLSDQKIIAKVAPLNFVDRISLQTAQIGFEFHLSPAYSIDFSYGHVFGRESLNDARGGGFKAKTELRNYNYPFIQLKNVREYWALEGFFHKIDYPSHGTFENIEDSTIYEEDYFIKKDVWGLNVKYGLVLNLSKRFVVDFYVGGGFRIKNVDHFERVRLDDQFTSVDILAVHIRDKPGNYVTPNLSTGFKIGFVIK
jgi:hypothetical protein